MTRTYAIPDLHGRADLLDLATNAIARHSSGNGDKIVTLGDYVDRGPDSRDVIERLMNWKSDSLPLVALKGNHETIMWHVCNRLAERRWWIRNGGDATLASYLRSRNTGSVATIPQAHLDWIARLPLVYADKHRVFVHAGLDPSLPLDKQTEQAALWLRYPKGHNSGYGQRHIVHGHDADPAAPLVTRGRTNLDGLAWKTGRLVIGVFEDDRAGGADQFLEVRAASA